MNTTGSTDADGNKEYTNISPGNYTVSMNSNSQYEFIDYDPSSISNQFALVPGASSTYTLRVADKNADSLFVTVTNTSGSPIAGAQITLTDENSADVFSGKLTSNRGIFFYPDGETSLVAGAYTLKIEASGYTTQTKSITINKLTQETIKLEAS